MPKVKQLAAKCKHPNSRKMKAFAKQINKKNKREKSKMAGNIKLNLLGEKVLWFQQNLDPDWKTCTPRDMTLLVLKYIRRFHEELEQIRLKNSIGARSRQHASREDIMNLTLKRELEEYNTCGLEVPDLVDPVQFELLKTWNGELRYLQKFKLRRITYNTYKNEMDINTQTQDQNTENTNKDITENME